MNYKILRIIGMNLDEIRNVYREHTQLKQLSYDKQREFLLKQRFGYFNGFTRCMESLGNEAIDIIYDLESLQKKWAEEHGVKYTKKEWQSEILLAQVAFYKPEVLYCYQDIRALPRFIQKEAKAFFPFLQLFIAYRGFPGFVKEFREVDALFTATPRLRDEYQKEGIQARLLYHSFDDSVLGELEGKDCNSLPLSFVGSSGYGQGPYQYSRYWALRELIKKTDIRLWLLERKEHEESIERGKTWFPTKFEPMKAIGKLYPHRCEKTVFGMEMFRILYASKLTFNIHVEMAIDCVGNMRMFEATGVGTCLITDTGKNMTELFEPDTEIVTYDSIDDCIEKINYLRGHEKERTQIAEAGRKRTLKNHTLQKRCEELDDYIKEMLKK
ncbi:MAG: glycosyltransferase [bacterium]|nr:glycosyltransferase [bacterium]